MVKRGDVWGRNLSVACFISQLLAGSPAVRAQETASAGAPLTISAIVETPGAEAFRRGLEALQEHRERDAVDEFRRAFELEANPAALLNLGIAYTNLAKPQAAVDALTAYMEQADPQRDAETVSAARAEIERLRAENGRVLLTLVPIGAELQVDGEKVEIKGEELLLAPGHRRISVRADGYLPFNQTLEVQPGQFRLAVRLTPTAQKTAAAAPAALQAPAAPAAEPAEPAEDPEAHAADSCAMGPVCAGPVLALLGPPNLVGGGLHLRFGRYLGAGVDYQFLPTINVNPISVGTSLVSANARVYPFGGAFFLGGGFAYQTINATLRDGDIAAAAKVSFPAATANIGFMGHDGFILGADIGLMFPLSSTHVSVRDMSGKLAQAGATQEQIDSTKQQAEQKVSAVMNALPVFLQVNLIRVGYMF